MMRDLDFVIGREGRLKKGRRQLKEIRCAIPFLVEFDHDRVF